MKRRRGAGGISINQGEKWRQRGVAVIERSDISLAASEICARRQAKTKMANRNAMIEAAWQWRIGMKGEWRRYR